MEYKSPPKSQGKKWTSSQQGLIGHFEFLVEIGRRLSKLCFLLVYTRSTRRVLADRDRSVGPLAYFSGLLWAPPQLEQEQLRKALSFASPRKTI